jgi:hypothetical protein
MKSSFRTKLAVVVFTLACLFVLSLWRASFTPTATATILPPPIPAASPKINKCHRCLDSRLECVKKDEKDNCIQWTYKCVQWETYPC